jgi:hypothetical protein
MSEQYHGDHFHQFLAKYELQDRYFSSGVSKGWIPLLEECVEELFEAGWDGKFDQIKQKFGGLRFYIPSNDPVLLSIISNYENKSMETCEGCSAPGRTRGGYWLETLCDECEAGRGR